MTQHMTAVGRCHVHPALTNTCLMNPPFEPDIGDPMGFVTKKFLSPMERTI
jgi:hypothetical protein